jgi:hypothetical protein
MPAGKYDLVKLKIGYQFFVVPRKLAMLVFDAAQGEDFYKWEYDWKDGTSTYYAQDINPGESFIVVESLSPAQFHTARIAWQDKKAKADAPTTT